jgi:hypothetical protein
MEYGQIFSTQASQQVVVKIREGLSKVWVRRKELPI